MATLQFIFVPDQNMRFKLIGAIQSTSLAQLDELLKSRRFWRNTSDDPNVAEWWSDIPVNEIRLKNDVAGAADAFCVVEGIHTSKIYMESDPQS